MPNFGGGPNFYYDPAARLAQAKFTANAYNSLGQGAGQIGNIGSQMFQAIAAKAEQDKMDKLKMITGLWDVVGVKAGGQAMAQEYQKLSGIPLPQKTSTYDPMGPNQPGQEPVPTGEIDLDAMDNTIQQKLASQKIEAERSNKILEAITRQSVANTNLEGTKYGADLGLQRENLRGKFHLQGIGLSDADRADLENALQGRKEQAASDLETQRQGGRTDRQNQADVERMNRLVTRGQQQQNLAKTTTKLGMVRDKNRAQLKQEYPAPAPVNPVSAAGLAMKQAKAVQSVEIHRLEVQLNAMIAANPNDPAIPDIQSQLKDAYQQYRESVGGIKIPGAPSTGGGGPPVDITNTHIKVPVSGGDYEHFRRR